MISGLPSVSLCSSRISWRVMRSDLLYCQSASGTSTSAMTASAPPSAISAVPTERQRVRDAGAHRLGAEAREAVELLRAARSRPPAPTTSKRASALPSSIRPRTENTRPRPLDRIESREIRHQRLAAEGPAADRQRREQRGGQQQPQQRRGRQPALRRRVLRVAAACGRRRRLRARQRQPVAHDRQQLRRPAPSPESQQAQAAGQHHRGGAQIARARHLALARAPRPAAFVTDFLSVPRSSVSAMRARS